MFCCKSAVPLDSELKDEDSTPLNSWPEGERDLWFKFDLPENNNDNILLKHRILFHEPMLKPKKSAFV